VAFPVAAAAVTAITRVLQAVFPKLGASNVPLFLVSLAIGLFVFYISLNPQGSRRESVQGFGIAMINSFFLAASALGIQVAVAK
jgi:hypothetical protein